ncbi:hypothetical protein VTP21DRAFT_2254 [Calcarisporiella thermophila]
MVIVYLLDSQVEQNLDNRPYQRENFRQP